MERFKITSYAKNIKDLPDHPNMTAAELKAWFDGRTDEEVKTSINGIVESLMAKTGAGEVGAEHQGKKMTVQEALDQKVTGAGLYFLRKTSGNKLEMSENGVDFEEVHADGEMGPVGPGVPQKGMPGQLLVKNGEEDFDTRWEDPFSLYEADCTYSEGVYTLAVVNAPTTLPKVLSLRFAAPESFKTGDVFKMGEEILAPVTAASQEALETEAFLAGRILLAHVDRENLTINFSLGGAGHIKSVQRGIYNFGNSSLQTDITIDAVDPACTVAYTTGLKSHGSDLYGSSGLLAGRPPYVEVTDATTLSIKRMVAGGDVYTYVPYEVVEYRNVKSLQKGSIEFRGNTKDAMTFAIEPVDPDKTVIYAQWVFNPTGDSNGNSHGNKIGHMMASVTLTNPTTLTLGKAKANGGMYGHSGGYLVYQIIEFK